MTTITLPRATVEQALEALVSESSLSAVAMQRRMDSIIALRAALAQQEEPAGTRALIEECLAALAEPTGKESLQVEPTVAENATTQQQIEDTPPSDYRRGYWDGFRIGKREGRIEAEDVLAEPMQEPVAWMYPDDYAGILKHQSRAEVFQKAWCNPAVCVPLYTAPPQRPAEPVQEPVAWLSRDDARLALWEAINKREFGNPTDDKLILDYLRQRGLWIGKYTAPPQRTPLTDEEMRSCAQAMDAEPLAEGWPELIKFARAIERAHGIKE